MAFTADDIWQGDESIYMQEMIILQQDTKKPKTLIFRILQSNKD